MNNMKNVVKKIFEYVIVFAILLFLCLWVNKGIKIKGLYMDDLFNWSWFPGISLFDFAFKFYGASRYRPFFDALQYIEYIIVKNRVFLFTYVNIFLNTLLALFIYHFAKRLKASVLISLLVSILYVVSHFAYYQIGQVLGLLETEAQFLALLILFVSLKLTGIIDGGYKVWRVAIIYILYFIIAFTHERYLCLAAVIVPSIIFAKREINLENIKEKVNPKIICIIIFIIEIIGICILRKFAIGKMLPAGTGGTSVEETFSLITCLQYCINQVLFIFGINIGPEHLVGVQFVDISRRFIKFMGLASIIFIIVIAIIYFVKKINSKKETNENFIVDLLFALFIAMCIGASSVTIRVEMRFVYVSFTASLLYFAYMTSFLKKYTFISIVVMVLSVGFFVTRVPLELQYRTYYKNIHFFLDLDRVNSIYDLTIGKYGVDEVLHKKKIYMLNENYGFTDFYAKWFFKIYDKDVFGENLNEENIKNMGNDIILIKDISELPQDIDKENTILLAENPGNFREYIEIPLN